MFFGDLRFPVIRSMRSSKSAIQGMIVSTQNRIVLFCMVLYCGGMFCYEVNCSVLFQPLNAVICANDLRYSIVIR